jgi:hypothetical protein
MGCYVCEAGFAAFSVCNDMPVVMYEACPSSGQEIVVSLYELLAPDAHVVDAQLWDTKQLLLTGPQRWQPIAHLTMHNVVGKSFKSKAADPSLACPSNLKCPELSKPLLG